MIFRLLHESFIFEIYILNVWEFEFNFFLSESFLGGSIFANQTPSKEYISNSDLLELHEVFC